MARTTFRELPLKFYLNANHFIVINGKEGEIHPHTWEFMVDVLMSDQKFVQFDAYEKAIDEYFNKYQNRILNEVEPFDHMVPTLENMSDYFADEIRGIVKELGGHLVKMESSETPTRSYVISFEREQEYLESIRKSSKQQMSDVIDGILDRIID